jgi:hypothetical protein
MLALILGKKVRKKSKKKELENESVTNSVHFKAPCLNNAYVVLKPLYLFSNHRIDDSSHIFRR